jgi:hypothetical protein
MKSSSSSSAFPAGTYLLNINYGKPMHVLVYIRVCVCVCVCVYVCMYVCMYV